MLCQGQQLNLNQWTALFSILGTTYGGNGQTTFGLPDLRGRTLIGVGQGPGLPNVNLGEISGTPTVTLLQSNMPAHNHVITGKVQIPVNDSNSDADGPVGAYLGTPASSIYSSSQNGFAADTVSTLATGIAGSNIPFSNMQPYLGITYIICVEGLFPSRN